MARPLSRESLQASATTAQIYSALITNPPKTCLPMWVYARNAMFCNEVATHGLNKVSGIMIKADLLGRENRWRTWLRGIRQPLRDAGVGVLRPPPPPSLDGRSTDTEFVGRRPHADVSTRQQDKR